MSWLVGGIVPLLLFLSWSLALALPAHATEPVLAEGERDVGLTIRLEPHRSGSRAR
ncbi:hypothetical protein [Halomonas sp. BC04]|uniref:hypothetical protein n=1 Tax=Halomonas sp. BC04 TaxID=1403540 RepID=UPI0003ED5D15|nr:hypothetical protein [Halomonas sp. BC04]EWG99672.1 hypothetical protein Q427_23605 [Halomonas sp. BC04]